MVRRRAALLVPDARCPRCGSPPPLHITPLERLKHRGDAPSTVLATVRCGVHCPTIYPLTAAAYQAAKVAAA